MKLIKRIRSLTCPDRPTGKLVEIVFEGKELGCAVELDGGYVVYTDPPLTPLSTLEEISERLADDYVNDYEEGLDKALNALKEAKALRKELRRQNRAKLSPTSPAYSWPFPVNQRRG